MPAQSATSSAAKRRWFITVLIAMVILAAVAGIALSRLRQADAASGLAADPAASTEAAAGIASVPPPQATTHTSQAVPTRKVTASAAPTTTAALTGPVIVTFRVATKPSCPSGTDQVQYEGQPVLLKWKVTGADKTTLSVDGPGVYNEYATEDSATLSFPCNGEPGTYQTHTYTLRAIGPDGTTSRKLAVQAKVNEIATT